MQIQNPMMFVRSLKGAPSSMLWVLIIVRQALTLSQLCAYTGYGDEPLRRAAKVLQGYELVVTNKRAHGEEIYSLGQGYQFLLPGLDPGALARVGVMSNPESNLNQLWEQPAEENQQVGEIQSPFKTDSDENIAGFVQQNEIQNPFKLDSGFENGQNLGQSPLKTDSETGSIKILIDDDESIFKDNSSSSILNPKRKFPNLETVLSNLDIIFDDELHVGDVPADTPPELALAWVSKLYKDKYIDRRNLDNPIGTLITRLRSKTRRKMHLKFLPDEYLIAIGLWQKRCAFCDVEFTSKDEFDLHLLAGHKQDEPDLDNILVFQPTQPIGELEQPTLIWQSVLELIKPEMGRSQFDSWVKNTVVVGWDNDTLTVGADRNYAQQWLTKNITHLAEKITGDVFERAVKVCFVVSDRRAE